MENNLKKLIIEALNKPSQTLTEQSNGNNDDLKSKVTGRYDEDYMSNVEGHNISGYFGHERDDPIIDFHVRHPKEGDSSARYEQTDLSEDPMSFQVSWSPHNDPGVWQWHPSVSDEDKQKILNDVSDFLNHHANIYNGTGTYLNR